jgi:cold shock CspA family protein
VKWYNAVKRYGFVELSDGSGDAFLHASALASISVDALQLGVTIEFRTAGPCARVGRSRSKSGPRRKLAVTQIAIRDLPPLGECDFSVRSCLRPSDSVFVGNSWETYGPPLSK